jgi:hypothetical protein
MQNPLDAHGLDHGFFQFPRPTVRHFIGYFIAGAMFLFAFSLYSSSLDIPDVPRVDEATQLPSLLEDHAVYDYGPLQQGYESGNYASKAAFVIVPLELESGTIAYDNCRYVEDDEGGGSWEYSFDMDYANQLTFVDKDENRIIAAFAYDGSLDPEGEVDQPSCGSSWSRTIEGFGENDPANYLFNVYLLVEEDPERFQVLSVVEISSFYSQTPPQEVTQREDRGRWSLLALGVGGLVFMYSTTPSLKYDLGRIRKENGNLTKDITSSGSEVGLAVWSPSAPDILCNSLRTGWRRWLAEGTSQKDGDAKTRHDDSLQHWCHHLLWFLHLAFSRLAGSRRVHMAHDTGVGNDRLRDLGQPNLVHFCLEAIQTCPIGE